MAEYEGIKSNRMNGQAFMTRQFSRCRIISHAILYVLFLLFLTMPTFPAFAEDSGGYVETIYSRENGLSCGEANDITETSDGILWIGTYAGLYRYNGKEFKLMRDFDSVRNVNCLYVDDADRLFIGTNDSGVSVSKQETVVDVMNEAEGLDANSVRAIVKSSDGNYYIGTSGNLQIFHLKSRKQDPAQRAPGQMIPRRKPLRQQMMQQLLKNPVVSSFSVRSPESIMRRASALTETDMWQQSPLKVRFIFYPVPKSSVP